MAKLRVKRTAYRLHEGHTYSCAIGPVGNVPLNQTYLQSANEYDFDRTAVPVTVSPSITCDGNDLDLTQLTGKAWYEVAADGTETQITSANTDYTLYPTGYPCGIQIKKNGDVSLVFRAKHWSVSITGRVSAKKQTAAEPQLELELDAPTSQVWDPFSSTGDAPLVITPRAHRAGKTVTATIKWQRLDNGTWRDVNPYVVGDTTTNPFDSDVEIDSTTGALTVYRRFMGESSFFRCFATHGGSTRTADVSITRRIPEYRAETLMSAYMPDKGDNYHAEAYIRYAGGGRIANPSQELNIEWYVNDSTTAAGQGNSIDIRSTGDQVDVEMTVEDRGALGVAVDETDGNRPFCDPADGKILYW